MESLRLAVPFKSELMGLDSTKSGLQAICLTLMRGIAVTTIVAIVGILLLVYFAVLVGIEMDTDRQRRERKKLAEVRRRNRFGICDDCPSKDLLDE